MEKLTTDELIDIIINETGLPLPIFEYNNYRKFLTVVPENITIGSETTGIENADLHDTFREGCIRIINWYNSIK